jgi:PAS domain S-box-containing protein
MGGADLGGETQHLETVRQRRDARRVDISISASPVRGADGKLIGASKIVRDIGECKRAERALH